MSLSMMSFNIPTPETIMTQASKFWVKMAERYAKSPVADEESYQKKLQATRD